MLECVCPPVFELFSFILFRKKHLYIFSFLFVRGWTKICRQQGLEPNFSFYSYTLLLRPSISYIRYMGTCDIFVRVFMYVQHHTHVCTCTVYFTYTIYIIFSVTFTVSPTVRNGTKPNTSIIAVVVFVAIRPFVHHSYRTHNTLDVCVQWWIQSDPFILWTYIDELGLRLSVDY